MNTLLVRAAALAVIIVALPSYAEPDNLSGSRIENDVSASDVNVVHEMLGAVFDGRNLSLRFVKGIAKDPVITFGTVRDANGEEVQGEVWLVVANVLHVRIGCAVAYQQAGTSRCEASR